MDTETKREYKKKAVPEMIGLLPLKKIWVLTAPLLIAGIGFLLEWFLPLPFNGLSLGFESFGWIVMFLGGIQSVKKD